MTVTCLGAPASGEQTANGAGRPEMRAMRLAAAGARPRGTTFSRGRPRRSSLVRGLGRRSRPSPNGVERVGRRQPWGCRSRQGEAVGVQIVRASGKAMERKDLEERRQFYWIRDARRGSGKVWTARVRSERGKANMPFRIRNGSHLLTPILLTERTPPTQPPNRFRTSPPTPARRAVANTRRARCHF